MDRRSHVEAAVSYGLRKRLAILPRHEVRIPWRVNNRGRSAKHGISLANSELYLTIAHIVTKFEMELYDTALERNVEIRHDCFIGVTDTSSPGIQVKITEVLGN